MTSAPATVGQAVIYHGSLTAYHGPAVFRGVCEPCGECTALLDNWADAGTSSAAWHQAPPMRYRLEFSGGPNDGLQVDHVRPESFTAIVPDSAALTCSGLNAITPCSRLAEPGGRQCRECRTACDAFDANHDV